MYWFWLNIPLAAALVATWTGIPLWLVLKHPDVGPHAAAVGPHAAAAAPQAAAAGPHAAAAGHGEPSSDSRRQIPDRVLAR